MNLIHSSILFSAVERYGSLFFFLASTAILSRLLSPAEFGIYALISALTAVAGASFQEFGGANYLIQRKSLSEQSIRTAFTITFCLSAAFAALLFELRGVAAWFFSEDALKIGITISAFNFLLSPFLLTISALLRRDMAFGTLARCNLIGNFINAVISITFAALGYSYMAPLLGAVAGNAATVALLIGAWRGLRIFMPSLVGWRDVIGFGGYSACTSLMNVFYNMAPQLILGRVLDFNAVGLYGRATTVTQMFERLVIQVVNPVIMPAICAETRAGGQLRRLYLNAAELLAAMQWPFLILFALMAESIVGIWLGPTWNEIVPLIQVLCIASVALFAACLTYPFLVAVGRVRDTFVSSLISLPPSLIILFVASFFGVNAVAASALVTSPFQAIVAFYFIGRQLAITPSDLIGAVRKSAIVAACSTAGVVLSIATAQFSGAGPVAGLLLACVFAATGWYLGLVMTRHPLLTQVRSALRGVVVAMPSFARLPIVRRSFVDANE